MRSIVMALVLTVTLTGTAGAQTAPVPIGVIGDSTTDSYRAEDNRGGTCCRASTYNYLELLVRAGRVDAGAWSYYGGSRRTDYARNWARSGATSYDVIAGGQHTGLAAQARATFVRFAVSSYGANDFHYNSSYRTVYEGTLSGTALQSKISSLAGLKVKAVNALIDAGVNVVVLPTADYGLTPAVMATYPDGAKRARVSSAIAQINALVKAYYANNPAVAIVTGAEALAIVPGPTFVYGGVTMNCVAQGDTPTYCILRDKHAGTVMSALLANLIIAEANEHFGAGILPLTPAEVWALAGR